jgi:uncharacterized protein YfaP (DUF2135 family)
MNRLLLAATLGLTTLTANAVCPTSLSGNYSGSGEYTEQAVINNKAVISYVEYHIVSVNFTTSMMHVIREFYAATGSGGPAVSEITGSVPYTYDRSTCTGQIGSSADPMYFTVGNNGNNVRIVHGKAPKSVYFYAERWDLIKQ